MNILSAHSISRSEIRRTCCGIRRRIYLIVALNILQVLGCGQSENHDVDAARGQAVEFARAAFVQNRIEYSYTMLSDNLKRHVPISDLWTTVARLHLDGYPTAVKATQVTIERAENRMLYVFLVGEGTTGKQFRYRITLEGSAELGYKVALFRREFGSLSDARLR